MKCSQVSFTSGIHVVNASEFSEAKKLIPNKYNVQSPWTAKEIVKTRKGYTEGVRTCTAGGLIVDGKSSKEVVLFHLCPPEEATPENKDFSTIEKTFMAKLARSKAVQGLLIGSKSFVDYRCSTNFFEKIEAFFKSLGMPYSKFKDQPTFSEVNLLYNGDRDTWLIYIPTCSGAAPPKNITRAFSDVFVCENDRIITEA